MQVVCKPLCLHRVLTDMGQRVALLMQDIFLFVFYSELVNTFFLVAKLCSHEHL